MHALNGIQWLRELAGFIRVNICIYVSSLAATGYLLFNKPDYALAYATLSSFFGCAAAYAYNNTTDVKEDLINRKRVNYFADKKSGIAIVVLCAILGLGLSLKISVESTAIYIPFVLFLTAYSFFRIKKRFLAKNLYTALAIAAALLIGAYANAKPSGTVGYYFLTSSFIFIGSLISDLRDIEGDTRVGARTLPVALGRETSKKIVYLTIATAALLIAASKNPALYPLLVPGVAIFAFIAKDRFSIAHAIGGISFIALFIYLLISGI